MLRVAFDLSRTTHVAFHQNAAGNSAHRERRREIKGTSGNHRLRLVHVRHDGFSGLASTGAEPGEGQRRTHQLEKVTATFYVFPFRGLAGKLAMQKILETFRPGDFIQTAPIVGACRRGKFLTNRPEVEMIGTVPGSLAPIWQNNFLVCLEIPDGVPPQEYVEMRWAWG